MNIYCGCSTPKYVIASILVALLLTVIVFVILLLKSNETKAIQSKSYNNYLLFNMIKHKMMPFFSTNFDLSTSLEYI